MSGIRFNHNLEVCFYGFNSTRRNNELNHVYAYKHKVSTTDSLLESPDIMFFLDSDDYGKTKRQNDIDFISTHKPEKTKLIVIRIYNIGSASSPIAYESSDEAKSYDKNVRENLFPNMGKSLHIFQTPEEICYTMIKTIVDTWISKLMTEKYIYPFMELIGDSAIELRNKVKNKESPTVDESDVLKALSDKTSETKSSPIMDEIKDESDLLKTPASSKNIKEEITNVAKDEVKETSQKNKKVTFSDEDSTVTTLNQIKSDIANIESKLNGRNNLNRVRVVLFLVQLLLLIAVLFSRSLQPETNTKSYLTENSMPCVFNFDEDSLTCNYHFNEILEEKEVTKEDL